MTSLSTGVSGLKAAQTAVNTTAHNLANVNTKGYSRQDVTNVDKIYNTIGNSHISYSQVGLGSEVACIKQTRNVFFDKAYRLEVGRKNFYDVQS
ncbi:MAG: flagellar hook-associated protein FlgK, partial [Lachnospiraceae bacterium]|nr:flagellar hook-associated protein FlgK [Lachnospiraceae bacterium]